MAERVDPKTFAHRAIRRIALANGGTATDAYLRRFVDEMLELCPGVRESLVDDLMEELKEEIAQKEDPRYSRATIGLIEEIQRDWRNER